MKKKLLIISDHALSSSGVGVQSKLLIEGLLKTGKYTVVQLGAAVRHQSLESVKVNDDFCIKPVNGFGNANLIRSFLINELPDALIIFSDPRFFEYLFEIEDEVHQICPILWWHVWDNKPYPDFNKWMYDSVDTINCLSYLTYDLLSQNIKENKINYIPHSYPKEMFYKLKKEEIIKEKERILDKENVDSFVCLWVNRNCKRKRPLDLIVSWRAFLDMLPAPERRKCLLIMHTDIKDAHGVDLESIVNYLDLDKNVIFSTLKINTKMLNILYNISDVTINISFNEGFGLTTLESMMTQTPIIAVKTGGLERQVVNHISLEENGVAIEVDYITVSGNQKVKFLNEDHSSCENIANSIKKFYKFDKNKKLDLGKKSYEYAIKEFNYENCIDLWDKSIEKTIKDFKTRSRFEIINC